MGGVSNDNALPESVVSQLKIVCPECQNEVELDAARQYQVGDVVECPFCGSELEVAKIDDDGQLEVQVIMEEK